MFLFRSRKQHFIIKLFWATQLCVFYIAEQWFSSRWLSYSYSETSFTNSCDPMDCSLPGSSVHVNYVSIKARGFPGDSNGEESACNAGDSGSFPWRKIPWRRKWQPTPVFLPWESHGQRSLMGYSLWGYKELDTTEQRTLKYYQKVM